MAYFFSLRDVKQQRIINRRHADIHGRQIDAAHRKHGEHSRQFIGKSEQKAVHCEHDAGKERQDECKQPRKKRRHHQKLQNRHDDEIRDERRKGNSMKIPCANRQCRKLCTKRQRQPIPQRARQRREKPPFPQPWRKAKQSRRRSEGELEADVVKEQR